MTDNEAFIRGNQAGTPMHHNVFVNVGFQRPYYPSGGVTLSAGSFYNNTIDRSIWPLRAVSSGSMPSPC